MGAIRTAFFALGAFALPLRAAAAPPVSIVIDPGHGGSADSGSMAARTLSSANNATSPGGLREKHLTLELARLVAARVEALGRERGTPVRAVLTRSDDSNPDFARRAQTCADAAPACIVSLHFNATGGAAKALGTLAMTAMPARNSNFEADRAFAAGLTAACSAGVRRFLPDSRPRAPITDGHLHGGQGSNFFFQLARHPALARTPKCFLEVEFIDHPAVQRGLLDRRAETFPILADALAAHLVEFALSR